MKKSKNKKKNCSMCDYHVQPLDRNNNRYDACCMNQELNFDDEDKSSNCDFFYLSDEPLEPISK